MGPLEGITVLDFTQAYNGPYGTMNLADYGARVIKVERVDGGDQSRFWSPYSEDGNSGYFATYNRNKEGIAVDLGEEEGKELIKKLFAKVDVVVENFKFGTMDKLGVGYEVAKEINPGIIFASSSGFGQTGPLRKNTAYDNVIESMCGYMDMTGFPDQPPLRSGASIGDSYTGLMMAFAVVLACYDKKKTGKGKRIDVSMLDTIFSIIEDSVLTYTLTGKAVSRTGNAKPREVVPYDAYDCEDGYITVTVTDDSMWPDFCNALEMPELINDPLYATNDLRCQHYKSFTALMKKVMASKKLEWLENRFKRYKIPATRVYTPLEALEHPQLLARDMVMEVDDKNVGRFKTFGIPVKYSKTPGGIKKSSPKLGEDTCAIMLSLGYAQEEIDRLIKEEIVCTPETAPAVD